MLILSSLLAASFVGSLGFFDSLPAVLGVSILLGAANGLGAGVIQPLQAEALPADGGMAARDMNIIISAYTLSQLFAPLMCGALLTVFVHHGHGPHPAAPTGGGGSGSSMRASSEQSLSSEMVGDHTFTPAAASMMLYYTDDDRSGSAAGDTATSGASVEAYRIIWLSAAAVQVTCLPLLIFVKRGERSRGVALQ